jgi:serine/threonine-protein kinase HipA
MRWLAADRMQIPLSLPLAAKEAFGFSGRELSLEPASRQRSYLPGMGANLGCVTEQPVRFCFLKWETTALERYRSSSDEWMASNANSPGDVQWIDENASE